jgi:hypothetical protein
MPMLKIVVTAAETVLALVVVAILLSGPVAVFVLLDMHLQSRRFWKRVSAISGCSCHVCVRCQRIAVEIS